MAIVVPYRYKALRLKNPIPHLNKLDFSGNVEEDAEEQPRGHKYFDQCPFHADVNDERSSTVCLNNIL